MYLTGVYYLGGNETWGLEKSTEIVLKSIDLLTLFLRPN